MKLKVLLGIGIALICVGLMLSGTGCQPKESPDLPRYTEAQVTTIVCNYIGGQHNCVVKTSYEGNGIWKVRFSRKEAWYSVNSGYHPALECSGLDGKVVIFDEKTGALY